MRCVAYKTGALVSIDHRRARPPGGLLCSLCRQMRTVHTAPTLTVLEKKLAQASRIVEPSPQRAGAAAAPP
jgi:hypothetical protein